MEKNVLSLVTFFIWVNKDLENITILTGRFQGNFRLRSEKSLEMSNVFDTLHSLGYEEVRDFGELGD